jgi:tetratricopeptide (TPR) repeat protein
MLLLSVWSFRFVTVVKLLLPLLDIVLQHFIQRGLPACMKTETVEVLLAASTIGDRQSQLKVVAMAATFLGDDPPEYLQAALAHKQSILSRLEADFDRSELFIKDFCRRTRGLDPSGPVIQNFYQHLRPNLVDKRLNALCGRLHVSHLENLVQRDQYSTAVDEIDDWTTTENPSLMECRELPRKAVVVAKIFRSQGNFAEVRTTLERCFETLRPQDSNRFQVITGLADVYCDLGLAEKAFAKVAPEIEIEENKGSRGKSYRRLLVSAIDADLGQRLYENAERAIQKVESIFSDLSNLDVSDELLHVRALVASARICYYKLQFPEALRKWEVALVHVQKYKSFNGEGFTYAGIHLSICLAYLEIGNSTEGWNSFRRADIIFYRGMRDFWIPNFATRWLPDVQARIETLAGWKAHLQTKDG